MLYTSNTIPFSTKLRFKRKIQTLQGDKSALFATRLAHNRSDAVEQTGGKSLGNRIKIKTKEEANRFKDSKLFHSDLNSYSQVGYLNKETDIGLYTIPLPFYVATVAAGLLEIWKKNFFLQQNYHLSFSN